MVDSAFSSPHNFPGKNNLLKDSASSAKIQGCAGTYDVTVVYLDSSFNQQKLFNLNLFYVGGFNKNYTDKSVTVTWCIVTEDSTAPSNLISQKLNVMVRTCKWLMVQCRRVSSNCIGLIHRTVSVRGKMRRCCWGPGMSRHNRVSLPVWWISYVIRWIRQNRWHMDQMPFKLPNNSFSQT